MKSISLQTVDKVLVKPYTLSDLSNIYGVDRRTIRSWLMKFEDEIGAKSGRYYTIHQVNTIFNKLGLPFMKEST